MLRNSILKFLAFEMYDFATAYLYRNCSNRQENSLAVSFTFP